MDALFNPYYVDIVVFLIIYILLGLGLNLITGYAGQVSLGHGAFFGIGAYASGILSVKAGLNPWLAIALAIVITFVISAVLGLPSLRVREDFLAITTLGLGLIIQSYFKNSELTGGAYGLDSIPGLSFFGIEMKNVGYLLFVLIMLLVGIYALRKMTRSRIGRAWMVIREDETVAASMGINTTYYKVLVFAIGGAYAGAAGALFAHKVSFLSADSFGFTVSATVLSMVVIGGLGSIRGTLFGVSLLYLLPELFRLFDLQMFDMKYLDMYKMMFYGLLMVLVMRYRPKGIFGQTGIKMKPRGKGGGGRA
ncbi:branched-chain amino acid ABC transporter permease [Paenibacillus elgii]|uniref:Branched-chain amino acid ABC transporter permease n=1 Tax=Paenibacillus elgii TaxID=189691 RepID=A0A164ARK7_9BACL|nr:branched-chain amino acid ABC transporter permease [Paenibacillus elgii]KZE84429.1 branched-chain amino acid ABC transporter permease [Paenibacillus elgii]MCM3267625.1 branched-chain amino acid ABC transporter permease [Paenibacillus elgii]NEN81975.1 branched-chain amino acid ABC transporter permease [Paenibacillus elgii]PUA37700.1 branched-chain amino acid ABC transporter permease [Paenibacillus elgii]